MWEDGLIGQDRQEDYIRALAFELPPAHERPAAAERLAQLVVEADYHLATGFLSTSLLLPTLDAHGYAETAYRVVMQTTTPSLLHQVEQGATTTWETWPGYTRCGRAYMSHNQRRGDQVTLLVEVPPGTTAEILFDGRHEVEAGCYRFTGSVSGSNA